MNYLFIDKAKQGFEFAMQDNSWFHNNETTSKHFNPLKSTLQVISNGNFMVFFPKMYKLDRLYIKFTLEANLKDREDISASQVRLEIVPAIKKTLKMIHRFFEKDKEEQDDTDAMNGDVILLSKTSIFIICSFFRVIQVPRYIADDPAVEALYDMLDDMRPKKFLDYIVNDFRKSHYDFEYPLICGNSEDESFEVVFADQSKLSLKKEDFVCHLPE